MAGQVIYGLTAVLQALQGPQSVNRVHLARESRAKGAQRVVDEARARSVPFDFVPQAKLNELARTKEHQGVVAEVSPLKYARLDDCLAACGPVAHLLVLDQVQHPKNLGLMIRTAVGSGAAGVLIPARGGALLDESILRASAGTVFNIPVVVCKNLSQSLRRLKDEGFWVFGLEANGEDNVFEKPWPDRCALVVGNETSGLRPGVRKVCDSLVSIPVANELDSLNASNAAAIALFQIFASRRLLQK